MCAEVRACAVSALELGRLYIKQNPTWRATVPAASWMLNKELGAAQFTLQGTDPVDGVLNDSDYDPLVLTAIATQGSASHTAQVTLVPVVKPLAALSTCLAASGPITISAGKQIAVLGAPLSTNDKLKNQGTIDGNVEAQVLNQQGTITGTLTVPGTVRPMPAASVFTDYISKATTVPYAATMEKFVLGPGCNPFGPTDPNGLYVINTGNGSLTPSQLPDLRNPHHLSRQSQWSPSRMPYSCRTTAPTSPS